MGNRNSQIKDVTQPSESRTIKKDSIVSALNASAIRKQLQPPILTLKEYFETQRNISSKEALYNRHYCSRQRNLIPTNLYSANSHNFFDPSVPHGDRKIDERMEKKNHIFGQRQFSEIIRDRDPHYLNHPDGLGDKRTTFTEDNSDAETRLLTSSQTDSELESEEFKTTSSDSSASPSIIYSCTTEEKLRDSASTTGKESNQSYSWKAHNDQLLRNLREKRDTDKTTVSKATLTKYHISTTTSPERQIQAKQNTYCFGSNETELATMKSNHQYKSVAYNRRPNHVSSLKNGWTPLPALGFGNDEDGNICYTAYVRSGSFGLASNQWLIELRKKSARHLIGLCRQYRCKIDFLPQSAQYRGFIVHPMVIKGGCRADIVRCRNALPACIETYLITSNAQHWTAARPHR